VRNHLAMRFLREMKPGDEAFIYHSVSDKEVVGIAQVLGNLRRDPKDETNTFDCIDIAPLRRLKRPVSLAEFKAAGWHDFDLVRMSRLSVMAVPDHIRDWLLATENQPADTTKPAPRPKAAAKPKAATKAKAPVKKKAKAKSKAKPAAKA
jgi:predicted RNA-binding protein with PUA-like domain